jgi:hypothetical protein
VLWKGELKKNGRKDNTDKPEEYRLTKNQTPAVVWSLVFGIEYSIVIPYFP